MPIIRGKLLIIIFSTILLLVTLALLYLFGFFSYLHYKFSPPDKREYFQFDTSTNEKEGLNSFDAVIIAIDKDDITVMNDSGIKSYKLDESTYIQANISNSISLYDDGKRINSLLSEGVLQEEKPAHQGVVIIDPTFQAKVVNNVPIRGSLHFNLDRIQATSLMDILNSGDLVYLITKDNIVNQILVKKLTNRL